MFRRLVEKLFYYMGYKITMVPFENKKKGLFEEYDNMKFNYRYSPWNVNEDFIKCYDSVKDFTLVDKYRLYELWDLVEQTKELKGHVIEIGVWKGGSGCLIAKHIEQMDANTKVFLADTFSGVVKTGVNDEYYFGGEHCDTSLQVVNELLQNQLRSLKNVMVLPGIFPDETGSVVENEVFKLCHIDVDAYQSAKDIVEWIWNRLSVSGIIVFDDYGFKSCSGVTMYVNEIKNHRDKLFIYNINGHALIIKRY